MRPKVVLIDRLAHHCHIITIRGNSHRMQQHSDLWRALRASEEADAAPHPSGGDELSAFPR